jgi:predicted MFS family arabinose efflux permease
MTRAVYIKRIAVKPEDVTPSLTMGMALDHVMAISGSFLCGLVWDHFGPEYVFMIAGIISAINVFMVKGIQFKK